MFVTHRAPLWKYTRDWWLYIVTLKHTGMWSPESVQQFTLMRIIRFFRNVMTFEYIGKWMMKMISKQQKYICWKNYLKLFYILQYLIAYIDIFYIYIKNSVERNNNEMRYKIYCCANIHRHFSYISISRVIC